MFKIEADLKVEKENGVKDEEDILKEDRAEFTKIKQEIGQLND